MLTALGYKLLGSVMSLNSILPTPGLDCSTSPRGQMPLLHAISGSLAPWKLLCDITLWLESSCTMA